MIIENLLNRRQVMRMLSFIYSKKKTITKEISKELDIDYCYAVKIVIQLEKEEVIKCDRIGRKKYIELTSKGKDIAKLIYELNKLLV